MTDAPSPAARKPGRAWVGWLVRLAISALVLTVIFRLVPLQEVVREARKLSPWLWLGGLAAFLFGHAVSAAKWRLLIGEGISYSQAFRAHLAGLAANLCLPSVAGGDVVRAGLVYRQAKDPARLTAGSVADRLIDTLGLGLIAVIGGLAALSGGGSRNPNVLFIAAAVAGGIAATLAGVLLASRILENRAFTGRVGRLVRSVAAAISGLAREPGRLAACLILSLGIQTIFICINIAFANAAGVDASAAAWFFAWSSAKIIAIAPVSLGGLGVREASTALILKPFGADPAQVIAIGLIWQTLLYASGLLGLIIQAAWKPAAHDAPSGSSRAAIVEPTL